MATLNKIAHQVAWSGEDKSGMGRWGWVKMKKKKEGKSVFLQPTNLA